MGRVNERCFQFSPEELGLNGPVEPGKSLVSQVTDLRGSKIFAVWVSTNQDDCIVEFEYLCENGHLVLQKSSELPLKKDEYTRFQFGTYANLQLPAMFVRIVVRNNSLETAAIVARGMNQLQ
jgi:hypothetical protein